MRYHMLRFDIWLCLALSALAAWGTGKIADQIAASAYGAYEAAHIVADGEIGGKAGDDVFRAQSVEDLLGHDTFTIVSHGIEYCNHGAGFYGEWYMYAVTLPSGERIAAVINGDNVQSSGETIFDGDNTLPVGRVVYEDLSENTYFIEQIEYSEPLSSHTFYVDMLGTGGKLREEDYRKMPVLWTQIVTVCICFPLLHTLGSKAGIFPRFFPPMKKAPKKKSDVPWEIE